MFSRLFYQSLQATLLQVFSVKKKSKLQETHILTPFLSALKQNKNVQTIKNPWRDRLCFVLKESLKAVLVLKFPLVFKQLSIFNEKVFIHASNRFLLNISYHLVTLHGARQKMVNNQIQSQALWNMQSFGRTRQ